MQSAWDVLRQRRITSNMKPKTVRMQSAWDVLRQSLRIGSLLRRIEDAIRMGRAEAKSDNGFYIIPPWGDAIRMGRAEAKFLYAAHLIANHGCNPHGTC